jgi:hypothetical protein
VRLEKRLFASTELQGIQKELNNMKILFECQYCGIRGRVDKSLEGKKARCKCGEVVVVKDISPKEEKKVPDQHNDLTEKRSGLDRRVENKPIDPPDKRTCEDRRTSMSENDENGKTLTTVVGGNINVPSNLDEGATSANNKVNDRKTSPKKLDDYHQKGGDKRVENKPPIITDMSSGDRRNHFVIRIQRAIKSIKEFVVKINECANEVLNYIGKAVTYILAFSMLIGIFGGVILYFVSVIPYNDYSTTCSNFSVYLFVLFFISALLAGLFKLKLSDEDESNDWQLSDYYDSIKGFVIDNPDNWGLWPNKTLMRKYGEEINIKFGFKGMQEVNNNIRMSHGAGPARELERIWNGIGQWRG